MHEEKTLVDKFNTATDELEVCQRKIEKLRIDESKLGERSDSVRFEFRGLNQGQRKLIGTSDWVRKQGESKVKQLSADLAKAKKELSDLQARKAQTAFVPHSSSLLLQSRS